MIIINILLVFIIVGLGKTILWLKCELDLAIIDRDAAQRLAVLKVGQYEEMKAFADESVNLIKKIGVE